MPSPVRRIYLAHEPDHADLAARLDSWERTNADAAAYAARHAHPVDSPEAAAIQRRLRAEIAAAEVVVCVIGPATFLDPWVQWELTAAREKSDRRGIVAIMLDELYPHPEPLLGAGTIFVKFRKNYVEDAVTLAAESVNPTNDIVLEE